MGHRCAHSILGMICWLDIAWHQDLQAEEGLLCCAGDRTWKAISRKHLPTTTMGHFLPTVSLNTLLPASLMWLCLLLVLDKMREGTRVQRSLNVIQGARKSSRAETAVWTLIHPQNCFPFRNLPKSRDLYNSTTKTNQPTKQNHSLTIISTLTWLIYQKIWNPCRQWRLAIVWSFFGQIHLLFNPNFTWEIKSYSQGKESAGNS